MNTQITTIANNYADGIIEYAASDIAKLGKILNDLQQIELLLQQSTDLNEVLKNPAISMEKKSEIIESVFGSEIDAHEKNFLKILIEKGRFNEFSGIILSLKNKFEDNIRLYDFANSCAYKVVYLEKMTKVVQDDGTELYFDYDEYKKEPTDETLIKRKSLKMIK